MILNPPKVSIVLPCFNESVDIFDAAIKSLLLQTFKDFECIVIDESVDIKKAEAYKKCCSIDPRFNYIHPDSRLGLAGSLNLGFSIARGEYIARFDSDDVCDPFRLERQFEFLEARKDIGVLGSSMNLIDSDGNFLAQRIYPYEHNEIEREFVHKNSIAHPAVMLRKSALKDEVGPYRPDFRFCEDLELWLRLLSKGVRFANLPEALVSYRQQSVVRSSENWKFNAKARWIHLGRPYFFYKSLMLVMLMVWMVLPKKLKSYIYKSFVYYRNV